MNKNDLTRLLLCVTLMSLIVSCSSEDESTKCTLLKLGIQSPENHWLLVVNDNGTISSATSIFNGVESQRFNYSYFSDKISIYLTDLAVSDQLACEIELDDQGRPISRTEFGKLYETLTYSGDKLDHAMLANKDSLVYRHSQSKNPDAVDFYEYNPSNKTWSLLHTTTFTYDAMKNPFKALILPVPGWNANAFLQENNQTSYSTGDESWNIEYTYNSQGYPLSRTLRSSSHQFNETINLEYTCD
jgi:YD repeat-containing protein